MNPSPGHKKWPDHQVAEKAVNALVCVEAGGETIAETRNAIEVDEDDFPPRYYIPESDIDMKKLSDSNMPARCPFKGEGHYYNINLENKRLENTAWKYDDPYEEHKALRDHIAFHDEMPGIELRIS
jgi:uncharacterized protein (DUF427 family)